MTLAGCAATGLGSARTVWRAHPLMDGNMAAGWKKSSTENRRKPPGVMKFTLPPTESMPAMSPAHTQRPSANASATTSQDVLRGDGHGKDQSRSAVTCIRCRHVRPCKETL